MHEPRSRAVSRARPAERHAAAVVHADEQPPARLTHRTASPRLAVLACPRAAPHGRGRPCDRGSPIRTGRPPARGCKPRGQGDPCAPAEGRRRRGPDRPHGRARADRERRPPTAAVLPWKRGRRAETQAPHGSGGDNNGRRRGNRCRASCAGHRAKTWCAGHRAKTWRCRVPALAASSSGRHRPPATAGVASAAARVAPPAADGRETARTHPELVGLRPPVRCGKLRFDGRRTPACVAGDAVGGHAALGLEGRRAGRPMSCRPAELPSSGGPVNCYRLLQPKRP
jgi:hypothetical protein